MHCGFTNDTSSVLRSTGSLPLVRRRSIREVNRAGLATKLKALAEPDDRVEREELSGLLADAVRCRTIRIAEE